MLIFQNYILQKNSIIRIKWINDKLKLKRTKITYLESQFSRPKFKDTNLKRLQ